MENPSTYITSEEIEKIHNKYSVLDYFKRLEMEGKVKFHRKTGHDYYFLTDENKFSVTDNKFYDFRQGEGGQLIKAVMLFENKTWKEALDRLKTLADLPPIDRELKAINQGSSKAHKPEIRLVQSPKNKKLINYFKGRSISEGVLKEYAKEIHYKINDKYYYGIGMENDSGGFEIRNPFMKTKLGVNGFSTLKGHKENEVIIFEGMTDTFSFLQLLKDNKRKNNRTLITLNSITNTKMFVKEYKDYEGKIFLCLDGDSAGDRTTQKIIEALPKANTKDIRTLYDIHKNKHNDLNDYLKEKTENQQKKSNLIQKDKSHENTQSRSNKVSESIHLGSQSFGQNFNQSGQNVQSNSSGSFYGKQNDGSTYAGGRPPSSKKHGAGYTSGRSNQKTQRKNDEKDNSAKHSLGRGLNLTYIPKLDELLFGINEIKITNEFIEQLVDHATKIGNNEVQLKKGLNITNRLKEIISQYKSGGTTKHGRGVLDEYYTDQKLVLAIGNLLQDKFKNRLHLKILEPSIGTGNFLSLKNSLPPNLAITGFEINPTTAKIAKLLHPNAEIHNRSFETEFIQENGLKNYEKSYSEIYDLVIGNPPYGKHRGLYKGLGEESSISRYEDYFVKRSLDSLKNDGILAMVLPSGWLRRQSKLRNANLLEAYKLPTGVFKNTQIGTDLIILQKDTQQQGIAISDYFENNPLHVLGTLKERINRFGKPEIYVHGSLEEALKLLSSLREERQTNQIGNLFSSLPLEIESKEEAKQESHKTAANLSLEGKQEEALRQITISIKNIEEMTFASPLMLEAKQKFLNIQTNLHASPSAYSKEELVNIILSTKNFIRKRTENSEYKIQSKPILQKGILKYQFKKSDSVVSAITQHSAKELSDREKQAFENTFYDGELKDPKKHKQFANLFEGKWIHDFYYIEGNIYKKLQQLELDFSDKLDNEDSLKQYEKQKILLKSVLPQPKTLDQIIMSPNHEFVHNFSMGTIERERYNYNTRKDETYMENYSLADKFKDFAANLSQDAFSGSSYWEVRSFVDNETVTGSDRERNALIRERRKEAANDLFQKFLREELDSTTQEKYVNSFNKNYNSIHIPNYSNFPLFSKIHQNFKGNKLQLTEVQKAGIGQLTTKGVGLLAHEVGFGKTLSGIIAMHEAMHRGNAKRPLIVVPNDNILKQWIDTLFETIPNARVNVLGNLGKSFDLSAFTVQDGDITLVTYSGFNNIGFSKEVTDELASRFSYISEQETRALKTTEREIQIELQKEEELKGIMKKGKIYDWEDFGFDYLTFDEVHNANHIIGKVRIGNRRFSSDFRSQQQRTSFLGINTWMAAQYIQDKNDGRNVALLSATPFTNKPLEYYSILSLIANNRLKELGFFNVNTFFETFMEADNDMEIDALGEVKFKTNVRRFKNNTLFQKLLSEFIDIKGTEDNPELVRPNRLNKEYKIEQNKVTKEQYKLLNQSFDQTEDGAILTHILKARLIAISPYLSPFYEAYYGSIPALKDFIENSPKLHATMQLIRQNKTDNPTAGQIIYSELGVSEFPKLKEYLVKYVGFSKEEVRIITGKTTKNQRIKIQDDFNSGKVKIVIGSSAIQEGMNLQANTTDLYLLSLPYNFTSLRQVEGRAWRQGNKWPKVRINYMLTNDTIDVFMLQKLQAKQARYREAIQNGADILDISDIDTHELKTALITNPETRADIEIELLKKKLEKEKQRLLADNAFVLRNYQEFLKIQEDLEREKQAYERYKVYANEDNAASYWKDQLVYQNKRILKAENKVQMAITDMAKKGVNVQEIKEQMAITEQKLSAIEERERNLPQKREELVSKYEQEKETRLQLQNTNDYITDRKNENQNFYRLASSPSLNKVIGISR